MGALLGTGTAVAAPAVGGVSAQGDGTKVVKNAKYIKTGCKTDGSHKLAMTSGKGKTTLVLKISDSVSAEWSANVSVTSSTVSAGVGFSVTKTYTVDKETRYEVPKGKRGYVEAYPCYQVYTFDVYNAYWDEKPVGNGVAEKPVGVYFKQWLTNS
ncbi:hypothetical protein RKE29_21445 [Streptomyces sp. B1866]|uniref:hypothetical protein n=1 Tax=Streptomyces sp. B1866 TaxID=3075431 RepID=UPI00288DCD7A|nr:hypothetical protein [Streptomyces sp. B1866]MDT3399180.1 hypothetical protein [Streptomyces sp. B1866]